jgi:hypothetical protein
VEEAGLRRPLNREASAHIELCVACYVFYEDRSALTRLLSELEVVAAPSNFEVQLHARIVAKQNAGRRFSIQPSFAPSAFSIALAACFAVTVSAVLIFQPSDSPQRNTWLSPDTESHSTARRATAPKAADATPSLGQPLWQSLSQQATDTAPDNYSLLHGKVKSAKLVEPRRAPHTSARTRTPDAVFIATEKRIDSVSFSLGLAQVVTPLGAAKLNTHASSDSLLSASSLSAIPVKVSPRPFEVVLRDEGGANQLISVEPVSFGATQLIGKSSDDNLISLSSGQGIW